MSVSLASTDRVEIRAFDLAGREVADIVDQWMVGGTHPVSWNGVGSNGRRVPTGVYFVDARFPGQGFRSARKVILVR